MVPWEDRIEEAHGIKASKYADLDDEIKDNGWEVYSGILSCRSRV